MFYTFENLAIDQTNTGNPLLDMPQSTSGSESVFTSIMDTLGLPTLPPTYSGDKTHITCFSLAFLHAGIHLPKDVTSVSSIPFIAVRPFFNGTRRARELVFAVVAQGPVATVNHISYLGKTSEGYVAHNWTADLARRFADGEKISVNLDLSSLLRGDLDDFHFHNMEIHDAEVETTLKFTTNGHSWGHVARTEHRFALRPDGRVFPVAGAGKRTCLDRAIQTATGIAFNGTCRAKDIDTEVVSGWEKVWQDIGLTPTFDATFVGKYSTQNHITFKKFEKANVLYHGIDLEKFEAGLRHDSPVTCVLSWKDLMSKRISRVGFFSASKGEIMLSALTPAKVSKLRAKENRKSPFIIKTRDDWIRDIIPDFWVIGKAPPKANVKEEKYQTLMSTISLLELDTLEISARPDSGGVVRLLFQTDNLPVLYPLSWLFLPDHLKWTLERMGNTPASLAILKETLRIRYLQHGGTDMKFFPQIAPLAPPEDLSDSVLDYSTPVSSLPPPFQPEIEEATDSEDGGNRSDDKVEGRISPSLTPPPLLSVGEGKKPVSSNILPGLKGNVSFSPSVHRPNMDPEKIPQIKLGSFASVLPTSTLDHLKEARNAKKNQLARRGRLIAQAIKEIDQASPYCADYSDWVLSLTSLAMSKVPEIRIAVSSTFSDLTGSLLKGRSQALEGIRRNSRKVLSNLWALESTLTTSIPSFLIQENDDGEKDVLEPSYKERWIAFLKEQSRRKIKYARDLGKVAHKACDKVATGVKTRATEAKQTAVKAKNTLVFSPLKKHFKTIKDYCVVAFNKNARLKIQSYGITTEALFTKGVFDPSVQAQAAIDKVSSLSAAICGIITFPFVSLLSWWRN
jgi:hypothetical protein